MPDERTPHSEWEAVRDALDKLYHFTPKSSEEVDIGRSQLHSDAIATTRRLEEQLGAPRHVTALRVGIDWHEHEGMVTVYDCDGHYMGCMGVERFHRLLQEDAISRGPNPRFGAGVSDCLCRNFGPVEYREVEPRCPLHGNQVAHRQPAPWPHSHADDPRLDGGIAHSPGDTNGADNLFVRCHTCDGAGCDDCGETGFDWTDTEQARATVRAACEESSPAKEPDA